MLSNIESRSIFLHITRYLFPKKSIAESQLDIHYPICVAGVVLRQSHAYWAGCFECALDHNGAAYKSHLVS
jgi:hypothetical protein